MVVAFATTCPLSFSRSIGGGSEYQLSSKRNYSYIHHYHTVYYFILEVLFDNN